MVNSFGFYVYNENKERILNPNLRDPYFKNSDNDSNVWTKWTSYILPLYMSDSNSDSQPDSQFDETNGVDWKWPHNARYVAARFGSCGNDSQNSKKDIVRRHIVLTSVPTSDSVKPTKRVDIESTSVNTESAPTKDFSDPLSATNESNTVPSAAAPTAPSTAPPTSPSTAPPTSLPPVTPAVDKTWYLNLSFRELKPSWRPEHVVVRTFNISDFREWQTKPNDTKGN